MLVTEIIDGHPVLVDLELHVIFEDREGGEDGGRSHGDRFPTTLPKIE